MVVIDVAEDDGEYEEKELVDDDEWKILRNMFLNEDLLRRSSIFWSTSTSRSVSRCLSGVSTEDTGDPLVLGVNDVVDVVRVWSEIDDCLEESIGVLEEAPVAELEVTSECAGESVAEDGGGVFGACIMAGNECLSTIWCLLTSPASNEFMRGMRCGADDRVCLPSLGWNTSPFGK